MKINSCVNWACHSLNKFTFLPILLSRLTLGIVFLVSGLGKFNHLDKVTGYFASLGIPNPHFTVVFTSLFEFTCGLLVLIGFATRLATIPLIVILLVAIKTAKWDDITGLYSVFQLSEFLYIVLLTWLMALGGGVFSVDHFIKTKINKNERNCC